MEEFNVGDIIYLRSGGPRMTVWRIEELDSGTKLHSVWFLEDSMGKFTGPYGDAFWSDTVVKDNIK